MGKYMGKRWILIARYDRFNLWCNENRCIECFGKYMDPNKTILTNKLKVE